MHWITCLGALALCADVGTDARADKNMCGLNSLALVLSYAGGRSEFDRLERVLRPEDAPYSLLDLERAARTLGYETRLARWSSVDAASFDLPCVVHLNDRYSHQDHGHFLACYGENRAGICLADFPKAPFLLTRSRLGTAWSGNVLYVSAPGSTGIRYLQLATYAPSMLSGIGALLITASILLLGRGAYRARRDSRFRAPQ